MTKENAEKKEYLCQYRELDREVKRMMAERRNLKLQAESITAKLTAMPRGGGTSRKVESIALAVADLDCAIMERYEEKLKLCKRILADIDSVRFTRLRELLYLRYIKGMPFEKIAEKMNYSVRQVHRIHGAALAAFKISEREGL